MFGWVKGTLPKKMIIVAIIVLSIVLALLGTHRYFAYIHIPENILKTALMESDLDLIEGSYILCRTVKVTGYDWVMLRNEKGEDVFEYVNIIGINPYGELKLDYHFELGRNVFIFYVEERVEYYTEHLNEKLIGYTATGWDILYPVKRDAFVSPRRYITADDMRQDAR